MQVDKLDLILKKVERLEKTINPPTWKKILHWILSNFVTLVILIFLAVVVWKTWGVVSDVLELTQSLNDGLTTFIEDAWETLKFWE